VVIILGSGATLKNYLTVKYLREFFSKWLFWRFIGFSPSGAERAGIWKLPQIFKRKTPPPCLRNGV
jgi:hypothetical protein